MEQVKAELKQVCEYPGCEETFEPNGRRRFCSAAHKQAYYRLRRDAIVSYGGVYKGVAVEVVWNQARERAELVWGSDFVKFDQHEWVIIYGQMYVAPAMSDVEKLLISLPRGPVGGMVMSRKVIWNCVFEFLAKNFDMPGVQTYNHLADFVLKTWTLMGEGEHAPQVRLWGDKGEWLKLSDLLGLVCYRREHFSLGARGDVAAMLHGRWRGTKFYNGPDKHEKAEWVKFLNAGFATGDATRHAGKTVYMFGPGVGVYDEAPDKAGKLDWAIDIELANGRNAKTRYASGVPATVREAEELQRMLLRYRMDEMLKGE